MKKSLISLILSVFIHISIIAEGAFTLESLKVEAKDSLPESAKIISESQDERSAFIAFKDGDANYQFTLSNDQESQQITEEKFTLQGRDCEFFRPMGESSGAIFIKMKNSGSLVIMVMYGMFSDEVVSASSLKEITGKIDLDKLELL